LPTHVLAHLSDLHLDGGPASAERTRRVLGYLDDLTGPLSALIVTGDLTAAGRPEEYELLAELLAAQRHPVATCPGNHDDRTAYRAVLGGTPVPTPDAPVNQLYRFDGLAVAMCDSTRPGEHGGVLTEATLAWLDDALATVPPEIPAVVGFHHPPVVLHSPILDGMRQDRPEPLAALLATHANVVAVLCGHAHTAASTTFAGVPLRVAPGVISTLTLPWETGDLLDLGQPPGLAFHVLDDAGPGWQVVTHYRTLA
jgi:3',5'-cyclic AMP phosphodiesterase CpdA